MRKIGKFIGWFIWIGFGVVLFIFWFQAMGKWLGTLGKILAIVISPGVVLFPAAYWIIEGIFPTLYFLLWGISILGIIMVGIFSKKE